MTTTWQIKNISAVGNFVYTCTCINATFLFELLGSLFFLIQAVSEAFTFMRSGKSVVSALEYNTILYMALHQTKSYTSDGVKFSGLFVFMCSLYIMVNSCLTQKEKDILPSLTYNLSNYDC